MEGGALGAGCGERGGGLEIPAGRVACGIGGDRELVVVGVAVGGAACPSPDGATAVVVPSSGRVRRPATSEPEDDQRQPEKQGDHGQESKHRKGRAVGR